MEHILLIAVGIIFFGMFMAVIANKVAERLTDIPEDVYECFGNDNLILVNGEES